MVASLTSAMVEKRRLIQWNRIV